MRQLRESETGYYPPKRSAAAGQSLVRVALGYPNLYRTGMSNLGLHIIYDLLNKRDDTSCERFFLPEKETVAEHFRTAAPLITLEGERPLANFDLVGFAVSFELDYFHIPLILELGKITPLAKSRDDREPIVIAGGPCATFNPAVLAPFIDAFVIGEGEETINHLAASYRTAKDNGASRREIIAALAKIKGVFVPSLYEWQNGLVIRPLPGSHAPSAISRQWVKDLDRYEAHTVVVTDQTEFDLYLLETARGCGHHCRFCMAGYAFRRPRSRSLKSILAAAQAAKKYEKRLGLMGAAISDHPEIDELCRRIIADQQTLSVASFRADAVTDTLVHSLATSGTKTLTIAPEAGSRAMRQVINKGIGEPDVWQTVKLGLAAGIRRFRLYMMIGLPHETPDDARAIADFALRLKDFMEEISDNHSPFFATLTISVNPFIPKPFTPFQWQPMAAKQYLLQRQKELTAALKKRRGIELKFESVKSSYIQGVLARGDYRTGEAIYQAYQKNKTAAFKEFFRAMEKNGQSPEDCLFREREKDEIFPWDIIDIGVRRDYLWQENLRAAKKEATIPCFDGCRRCGVCEREA